MATIDSLHPSITEMSRNEALQLILAIRESRRHTPAKRARKTKRPVQRFSFDQLKKQMSKEDMIKTLKDIGAI